MKRMLTIGGVWLTAAMCVMAQNTARYDEPGQTFHNAVRLYDNAKYGAAKRGFSYVERKLKEDNVYFRSEAMYYKAMCDVFLYHGNGASALRKFVDAYPGSNRVNEAYLQLGNFEYDSKRYQAAYAYYAQVDPEELGVKAEEKDRYFFRRGYSAFIQKKYAEAKLDFSRLKDTENRYRVVATYYYAYILYMEGYYQNALEAFSIIRDDPSFAQIIPLYMLQIYHVQGNSEKVLELGPGLMETANRKRAAEMGRLIGEAYYREGKYENALPYMLSFFRDAADVPDAEGRYILGYCYYKISYFDSAAVYFQGVLPLEPGPALRQATLYHLAYCYVQQNKKKFAMDAFAEASRIKGENAVLEEDAMYHYAQLAYELGLTPYHESLKVLEEFLETYPNSVYNKRIYAYMVNMYMTTRNYDMALASIEKIKNPTPELAEIEQRLYFNKGVEAFNRRAYATALLYFDRCVANGADESLSALAGFWQGECNFVAKKYKVAQNLYQKFVSRAGSKKYPEYEQALYNLGYTAMETVNYPLAVRYWKDFLSAVNPQTEASLVADAKVRLGDCLYMQESYAEAVKYYAEALQTGYNPADYARFQMAVCQGAMGNYREKAGNLLKIVESSLEPQNMPRVYSELASTYMMLDDTEKALLYYRRLRDQYPRSPLAVSAWAKMGLIYFNQGNNEEALRCFKYVVEHQPSTEEGRQALVSIRNIYMGMNQIDQFFAYARRLPHVRLNEAEQDSLTYLSAENFFHEENYPQAFNGFKAYVDAYPEGLFAVDAWRNAAVCAERMGDKDNALAAYTRLSQLPVPDAETATAKVAAMYYADKNYTSALGYYRKLKDMASDDADALVAKVGEMRCLRALGQNKALVEAALDLLRSDGVSVQEAEEARYFIAVAAPAIGENELAMQQYDILSRSKNPDYASRARYMILEQRVKAGFYDEAEKLIFDYVSQASMSEYYLVKTYLLWADIYFMKGNNLQAKQTLQSIIDNYEGEDLKDLARQKLDMIIQRENVELEKEQEYRSSRYSDQDDIILPAM